MDEKIKLISDYEEKNDCSFRKLSNSSIIICFFVAFVYLMVSIVAVIGATFAYYSVIDDGVVGLWHNFIMLCWFNRNFG